MSMEIRLNAPFVALLASVVGMIVAGVVVAVDPMGGPPLRQVSTYHVVKEIRLELAYRMAKVVQAECDIGDLVTAGGTTSPRRSIGFH